MNIVDYISKEDSDAVYEMVNIEYGLFTTFSCLFPNLKPGMRRYLSIIQFTVSAILVVINTIALMITLFLSLDDPTAAMQTLHFIVMNVIAFAILFSFNASRPEFSRFHRVMVGNVHLYDETTVRSLDGLKVDMKKKQKSFYIAFPLSISFAGLLIVFLGPISDYFSGDIDKNVYSETGVSLNLPVSCWTPFGSDNIVNYLISLSLQAGDHYVIVTTIVTANCIMFVMTKHMYFEIKLLITALKRLSERTEYTYEKVYGKKSTFDVNDYHSDPRIQYCYNLCLKENVKHHQKILRSFNDMNNFWSNILFVFFFMSTFSIAMSGILLMFGDGKITTTFNAISMGLTEAFDVFFICLCGMIISESSENLYLTLYKTKWFNASKGAATTVLIVMAMAKTPLSLDFNPVAKLPANLETFSNLMNTAYSYFNLLYAFRNEASD